MWNLTRLAYISMIKLHLVINIEQTSKIACLSHSLFCLSCILFFSFTKGLDIGRTLLNEESHFRALYGLVGIEKIEKGTDLL